MTGKPQSNTTKLRWQGLQRRIGLTGGIASGKSTVGKFLASNYSLPIIDADILAKETLAPGQSATNAVLARYGKAIVSEQINDFITINRSKLGEIIFNDPREKEWIEKLTHPIIYTKLNKELSYHKKAPILVLIIPLLFEAGLMELCSEIWLISCTKKEQINRLLARDGGSKKEAYSKIGAQWPLEKKASLADFVIDNNSNHKKLFDQVVRFLGNH